MSILRLENISRQFRTEPLWQDVTLTVEPGERLGILGSNGSGKTTLLRVMAGVEPVDRGRRSVASGVRVGYLPQSPTFASELSVLDALYHSQSEAIDLLRAHEEACRRLSKGDPEGRFAAEVSELAGRLEALGAWDLHTRARTILTRLGLPDMEARVGSLSVGQRKRVALAEALISEPDLLLLDEPTNHLDTAAIDWLEGYLRHFAGALVMITHDRYFLDRVTRRILEVEQGCVQLHEGNYASYLQEKDHQEKLRAASAEKRSNLLRREMEWLKRGPRARATKQKARQERILAMLEQGPRSTRGELALEQAGTASRLGRKGLLLHGLSKSYEGRPLLREFTLELQGGDRIGLVGPNGCGKTTLLDLVAGRVEPDQGWVEMGPTVVPGYYAQRSGDLPEETRAVDYVREVAEVLTRPDGSRITAESLMENFLFPRSMQHTPIHRLSGGERRRLELLRVLLGAPNLLLLDEPTNDLDLPTLVRLEAWLDDFPGILVVVSHDRYFLDRTVDRLFHFGVGGPSEFPGDYETLRQTLAEEERPPTPPRVRAPAPSPGAPSRDRRLSYKETRELQALEQEIERGDQRCLVLEQALAAPSSDAERLHSMYCELEGLQVRLAQALDRWAELAARAENG